jgi:hypothetical protein
MNIPPPIFTLQVNDSGAWRNVLKGDADQMTRIEPHIEAIAAIAGSRVSWRIIDAAVSNVICYCHGPDFIWHQPKRRPA